MNLPWSSPYLARGFAQDDVRLLDLTFGPASVLCRFSVIPGPDGAHPFHLSTVSAHRVVAQCGIDFICRATGLSKSILGEVWELNYTANYRRKILRSESLTASLQLVTRGWAGKLSTWLFRFEIEGGSFEGTLELAPGTAVNSADGTLVYDPSETDAYIRHYLSFYDSEADEASVNPSVYKPKTCVAFLPSLALVSQLRTLASDMAVCLQRLYDTYNNGDLLCAETSESNRVPHSNRPELPTMIRLDVIETSEGCKVVEVNAGNCGGVETYYRMFSFLRKRLFPSAPVIPKLLSLIVDMIVPSVTGRIAFCYLDEGQSKYLCLARRHILQRIFTGLRVEVGHLRDLLSAWDNDKLPDCIYRDFIYEELDPASDLGRRVEKLLLGLKPGQYFPSLTDEILSDKAYIAEVDQLVRSGRGARFNFNESDTSVWKKWMAPSTRVSRLKHHEAAIDFSTPDGIVLKPADGYGGDSVIIFPTCVLPINPSFYGQRPWVLQKFFNTPFYRLRRHENREEKVHLVHGVFLLPHMGKLEYGGTFTRLSPDPVVNIGNDGDVVLFCEPEWNQPPSLG
jgi:hypothetical protein